MSFSDWQLSFSSLLASISSSILRAFQCLPGRYTDQPWSLQQLLLSSGPFTSLRGREKSPQSRATSALIDLPDLHFKSRRKSWGCNSLTIHKHRFGGKRRNTDSGRGGDSVEHWQPQPLHAWPQALTRSPSLTNVYSCQTIRAPSRNDRTSTKQRRFESSKLITQRFQKVHITEPQRILQLTWRGRAETSNISPIGWQPSKHSFRITMILRTMETF